MHASSSWFVVMSSGRQTDGQGCRDGQIKDPLINSGRDERTTVNSKVRKMSGTTEDVKKAFKSKVSYIVFTDKILSRCKNIQFHDIVNKRSGYRRYGQCFGPCRLHEWINCGNLAHVQTDT